MRKIIGFVMIAFAMMMVVGCSQPTTPVDYTDDRLVTGSPWIGPTTLNFNNDGTGSEKDGFNNIKSWNWSTSGNTLIMNNVYTTYSISGKTLTIISSGTTFVYNN